MITTHSSSTNIFLSRLVIIFFLLVTGGSILFGYTDILNYLIVVFSIAISALYAIRICTKSYQQSPDWKATQESYRQSHQILERMNLNPDLSGQDRYAPKLISTPRLEFIDAIKSPVAMLTCLSAAGILFLNMQHYEAGINDLKDAAKLFLFCTLQLVFLSTFFTGFFLVVSEIIFGGNKQ